MADRPIIFGIPFSHFCQKAEWGLTQAGIEYDYVSVSLTKMRRFRTATTTGLVPAMVVNGELIEGSDRILRWAAERQKTGTPPLYPADIATAVAEWEDWAGVAVGPVARREAYRVAYNDPWHFTRNPVLHIVARLARPLILNILKHFKARRFDEEDKDAVPRIIIKVATRLRATGTGYLLTDQPTAADVAVAALCRPLLYAEPGRKYDETLGWDLVKEFIQGVKPANTTRRHKRPINEAQWRLLQDLAATA